MVIADTSVWVDHLADRGTPQVAALRELLPQDVVGIGDLILSEVLQGVRHERQFQDFRRRLLALEVFHMGGTDLAVKAAENCRALRSRGITFRGTVDCLIATFCIESRQVLLHNDRDFDAFEQHLGLRVLRLPAPL